MKYMPMDKELIAINQIKDLVCIHFEDMYLSGYSGKARIVPGFSIQYGNNQYMILTTLDCHFKEFVERLRKVYQEEKDHVVSRNFLGEQKIQIDELSKSILLSGELEQISDLYNHYENGHGYDQSLVFEIDRINAIIDIAKYHLQLFLLNFKKHFDNLRIQGGNNGHYYLTCTIDGLERIIPMEYRELSKNSFKFRFGNLVDAILPIEMTITFNMDSFNVNMDSLSVTTEIAGHEYMETDDYVYGDNGIKWKRDIYHNENLILYNEHDLPRLDNFDSNLINLDSTSSNLESFMLPWSAVLAVENRDLFINPDGTLEDTKDGDRRLLSRRMVYLDINEESYFIKEIASKRYYKKTPTQIISEGIHLDRMNKSVIGSKKDDYYLIETFFDIDGVTGFYKTDLLNKYFYHSSKADSLSDINSENTRLIGPEDGIYTNLDLLNFKEGKRR